MAVIEKTKDETLDIWLVNQISYAKNDLEMVRSYGNESDIAHSRGYLTALKHIQDKMTELWG